MIRIGDFSKLGKTTIKTLRYYEKEGLLIPSFVESNGYRYYETNQLIELAKIISLRQIGLTIEKIKKIKDGADIKDVLNYRKQEIKTLMEDYENQLSKINYILEENNMNYEVVKKNLPKCVVYYMEGVIDNYSKMSDFILKTANECLKINPDLKCTKPDYCFVNYLDGEYREHDINIRYCQAVEKKGNENELIKFVELDEVEAICVYHQGDYRLLGNAYGVIFKYIKENNLEAIDFPRECYIDGVWNKTNVDEYLTEIQIPVKTKY